MLRWLGTNYSKKITSCWFNSQLTFLKAVCIFPLCVREFMSISLSLSIQQNQMRGNISLQMLLWIIWSVSQSQDCLHPSVTFLLCWKLTFHVFRWGQFNNKSQSLYLTCCWVWIRNADWEIHSLVTDNQQNVGGSNCKADEQSPHWQQHNMIHTYSVCRSEKKGHQGMSTILTQVPDFPGKIHA